MQIKKTVSKIIAGVAVIGIAASASAFTGEVETKKLRASGYLTNNGTSFDLRDDYDPDQCLTDPNQTCAFEITSPDNIPNKPEHSQAELQNYINQNWVQATGTGVYDD